MLNIKIKVFSQTIAKTKIVMKLVANCSCYFDNKAWRKLIWSEPLNLQGQAIQCKMASNKVLQNCKYIHSLSLSLFLTVSLSLSHTHTHTHIHTWTKWHQEESLTKVQNIFSETKYWYLFLENCYSTLNSFLRTVKVNDTLFCIPATK